MELNKMNTRNVILENYTDYVLTHNQKPKSVYAFVSKSNIEEAEFYKYFSSFEAIDSAVFVDLFKNTINLLQQDKVFLEGDASHKLLSFYFTFFEMLTANRSLVMYILNENENRFTTLKTLDGLKNEYRGFIETLEIQSADALIDNIANIFDRGMTKISYGQLLFVINFWMEDTSPSFEKTDVLIEKSLKAGFEILKTKPINTIVDLGKFLWKEKMGKN